MKKLPVHLSTGILRATEHAVKIAQGKVKFKGRTAIIDMGSWVRLNNVSQKCYVCLGGSLLLWTGMKIPVSLVQLSSDFNPTPSWDPEIYKRMKALNQVRVGDVGEAISDWYGSMSPQYRRWCDLREAIGGSIESLGSQINLVSHHDEQFQVTALEAAKELAKYLRKIGA